MAYSVYVVDCETTGIDCKKHDVIEVCFWRLGEDASRTWHFKPLNPETIEDDALRVNGHLREDILGFNQAGRDKYKDPNSVLPEIEEWIMQDGAATEDRVFIGQNPEFDYGFLTELWKRTGSAETFPFGYWRDGEQNMGYTLDTIQLARWIDVLCGKKRKFYNLKSLVKDFGVKKAQAHRADGDVQMTKDLFMKISDPLRELVIATFAGMYGEEE